MRPSLKELFLEAELHKGKRAKLGEVKFIESSLNDKYIQTMIKKIAEVSGKDIKEIQEEAETMLKNREKNMTSELLHSTTAKNIAESVMYDLMEKYDFRDSEAPKFNAMIFKKLSIMIEAEHPSMFPMKSIISKKGIEPKYIFVPDASQPEYNDVETAAATNFGLFIYNKNFMQKLIDFAYNKGLKPQGKKYESNGGEIPDVYGYIETLILHEYLHYTMADNYYRKKFKANHKIINYVGDFRSNYALVKAGYPQLPIGLFSDHVNYDRQSSYKEMYDLVKAELEKQKQDNEDKKKDQSQGGDSGQDGEPQESDGDSGDSDGLDSHDDHTTEHDDDSIDQEHEEQEAKDDINKKNSQGKDGEEPTEEDLEKMDKKHKEFEDSLKDRKEVQNMEQAKAQRGERGAEGVNSKSGTVEIKDANAVNWKALMDKLVKKVSKAEMTSTYSKMHKRNIVSATLAVQTGSAVMKPGEKIASEEKQKLIFAIDSSGSMDSHIPLIHSQILHTIQKHNKSLEDEFYVVKFSNTAEAYRCSFKKKNYAKVPLTELSQKTVTKLDSGSKNLLELFNHKIGGATNFQTAMIDNLIKATKQGSSVMLFSDADVLYDENKKELQSLLNDSVKTSIGVVFADQREYEAFVKEFGSAYGKFVTILK